MKKYKIYYMLLAFFVLIISTIGVTYAYFTAKTSSEEKNVNTAAASYTISLKIRPLYPEKEDMSSFSLIPMNMADDFKAVKNKCFDKYGHGVCYAYIITGYNFPSSINSFTGFMEVSTNNMENISYMIMDTKEEFDEENCIKINEENYCKEYENNAILDGISPFSDATSFKLLENKTEKNIMLVVWLENLNEKQNEFDIGTFNSKITIDAGNGGRIQGSISFDVNTDLQSTKE